MYIDTITPHMLQDTSLSAKIAAQEPQVNMDVKMCCERVLLHFFSEGF